MHKYLVASSYFAAPFIKHVILSYVHSCTVQYYSVLLLDILICPSGTVVQYYFVLRFIHLKEVQDHYNDRSLG